MFNILCDDSQQRLAEQSKGARVGRCGAVREAAGSRQEKTPAALGERMNPCFQVLFVLEESWPPVMLGRELGEEPSLRECSREGSLGPEADTQGPPTTTSES